jgi:threonine dehydrogenase-like Zn-dependent dehydrogenase
MDGTLPQVEEPDDVSVRVRRCGRCQLDFPADPDLHATAQPGFWLCPPCRDALLGHQRTGRW